MREVRLWLIFTPSLNLLSASLISPELAPVADARSEPAKSISTMFETSVLMLLFVSSKNFC